MTTNAIRKTQQYTDKVNREKDDHYPTPPEATLALLKVEKFDGPIWEPACGEGHISEVLKTAGYDVYSSDLVPRGYGDSRIDFLIEYQPKAPNIITNPPFKMAQQFVEKSLQLTNGKVAMLLRLAFLEGKARRAMYENTPIARVHVFSERITMTRGGLSSQKENGMIPFAWFVWEHGYEGKPVLNWL